MTPWTRRLRRERPSRRWERLFAAETGDPVTATVVRLLGDGLLLNSLADDAEHDIDAILQWLDRRSSR